MKRQQLVALCRGLLNVAGPRAHYLGCECGGHNHPEDLTCSERMAGLRAAVEEEPNLEEIEWHTIDDQPPESAWYLVTVSVHRSSKLPVQINVSEYKGEWDTRWFVGPIVYWAEMPKGPKHD